MQVMQIAVAPLSDEFVAALLGIATSEHIQSALLSKGVAHPTIGAFLESARRCIHSHASLLLQRVPAVAAGARHGARG